MDRKPFKGNEERDDAIAGELLQFTANRLPHYRWLTKSFPAGGFGKDDKRED